MNPALLYPHNGKQQTIFNIPQLSQCIFEYGCVLDCTSTYNNSLSRSIDRPGVDQAQAQFQFQVSHVSAFLEPTAPPSSTGTTTTTTTIVAKLDHQQQQQQQQPVWIVKSASSSSSSAVCLPLSLCLLLLPFHLPAAIALPTRCKYMKLICTHFVARLRTVCGIRCMVCGASSSSSSCCCCSLGHSWVTAIVLLLLLSCTNNLQTISNKRLKL